MESWSALPSDLLVDIALRLIKIEEFTAFRGVCTWWRAVAPKNIFNGLSVDKAPLLMRMNINDECELRSYFKRGFRQPAVPEAKGKRCMHARFGWIVAVAPRGGDLYLFNPFFSSRIIQLPNLHTFSGYQCDPEASFVRKAILSANPSETSKFMVFALMNHVLGFWKNGGKNWTRIRIRMVTEPGIPRCVFTNIGYGGNKMYATDDDFRLWSWDPSATHMQLEQTLLLKPRMLHVLELTDGRLLAIAYYNNNLWSFKYIGTDSSSGGEWKAATDIGKDAIFVDQNGAVSIAADDFPGGAFKLTANTIYRISEQEDEDVNNQGRRKETYMWVIDIARRTWPAKCRPIESSSPKCPPSWVFP